MRCSRQWIAKWIYLLYLSYASAEVEINPKNGDFAKFTLVRPTVQDASKNGIISTSKINENSSQHVDQLALSIELDGEIRTIDLQLNKDLIPKTYFEKHQTNSEGEYVLKQPSIKDHELCQYRGSLRGISNSWAAISTCDGGIRGVVSDGLNIHYIENDNLSSNKSLSDTHYVYSNSDLVHNFTCSYPDSHRIHHQKNSFDHIRRKRDIGNAGNIRGPSNANEQSRYIELVLVVDNSEYKEFKGDLKKIYRHCHSIANIINSLYNPLNIFVALVGVVVWSEKDEIMIESNGDKTLTNFLHYRKERLVKEHPNDNAQLLTQMQFEGGVVGKALKGPICTYEYSGGVNMDHSDTVGLVAITIAHEMGHNLGMEHDSEDCICPKERCIMSPASSSYKPTDWSSCSLDYLLLAFEHGMDYCLRNKPERLFDSPLCGNGFVEPGEECDCGLPSTCKNSCCNATTCTLYSNATCATGECCNLETCQPRKAGTKCRSANHECDLPEYCDGSGEYCPENVYKIDGELCNYNKAFCYQGSCRSHSDQCELLWGPSGTSSDKECYKMNTKGSRYGNCGYNRVNQSYIRCDDQHVYCGMLQCKHLNERLEFGMESVSILSHSFINSNGAIIPCRTAIVDLGLNEVDPGLAPDGAKCGENKMCMNQKCMEVESLRAASSMVACEHSCNGHGVCNSRGHCHCEDGYAPPYCQYPGIGGSQDSGPSSDPADVRTPWTYLLYCGIFSVFIVVVLFSYYSVRSHVWTRKPKRISQVEKSKRNNSTFGPNNGYMSSPSMTNPVQSLLQTTEIQNPIQKELIGNFKGFSITPLQTVSPTNAVAKPTRPAPTLSDIPKIAAKQQIINITNVPKDARPVQIVKPTCVTQPAQQGANMPRNRPVISSPILDGTTSDAVNDLIGHEMVPTRAAPCIPSSRPASTFGVSSSSPKIIAPQEKSAKAPLSRIASFISKPPPKPECVKENVHQKAAKIDREKLRSMVISHPIPIEAGSEELSPSIDEKPLALARTQSFKFPKSGVNNRRGLRGFGSVRVPSSRPTSIPAYGRPKSPPPQPPSSPRDYVDCSLDIAKEEHEENIYAVIEETLDEKDKLNESSRGLSSTSDGLLSEIVSEIQARNTDSIYSGPPPAAREIPARVYENMRNCENAQNYSNAQACDKDSSQYDNGSITSSSGYLRPIDARIARNHSQGVEKLLKVPEIDAPKEAFSKNNIKSDKGVSSFAEDLKLALQKRNSNCVSSQEESHRESDRPACNESNGVSSKRANFSELQKKFQR